MFSSQIQYQFCFFVFSGDDLLVDCWKVERMSARVRCGSALQCSPGVFVDASIDADLRSVIRPSSRDQWRENWHQIRPKGMLCTSSATQYGVTWRVRESGHLINCFMCVWHKLSFTCGHFSPSSPALTHCRAIMSGE